MEYIKTRGIAILWDKILIGKEINHKGNKQFLFPGGTLEWGETLKECFHREMLEETGIEAKMGKLLDFEEIIHKDEWITAVNFFYKIDNPEDFKEIDLSKASHWNENIRIKFLSLDEIIKEDLVVYPFGKDYDKIAKLIKKEA